MEQRHYFQQMMLEQMDIHMQKKKKGESRHVHDMLYKN